MEITGHPFTLRKNDLSGVCLTKRDLFLLDKSWSDRQTDHGKKVTRRNDNNYLCPQKRATFSYFSFIFFFLFSSSSSSPPPLFLFFFSINSLKFKLGWALATRRSWFWRQTNIWKVSEYFYNFGRWFILSFWLELLDGLVQSAWVCFFSAGLDETKENSNNSENSMLQN